ncbi:hypothetical protein ILYODFUR_008957 [Ilyodon furcidens]|uniref:Uncharacterized protein n=1 Tax=Ilyodon furcidens TaxID=33524 RepID=A0ABV0VCD4_9TELE
MNLSDAPFLIHRVQQDAGPPFAAIAASTLLGRLSTRFRSVFMGILNHFSRKTFVRSWTRGHRVADQQGSDPEPRAVQSGPNLILNIYIELHVVQQCLISLALHLLLIWYSPAERLAPGCT